MKNLDYKKLKKIEMKVTKKLLEFINSSINIEELQEEIDFITPHLYDEASRLAFNIWLSTDYIGNDGKTFIDKFLEKNFLSLTDIEIQILKGKSHSHVSIFQVLKYEEEYMYIKDILNNKEYKLWEPHLNNTIYEEEFLFSRIGKVLDIYNFIGDINYIPSSSKTIFLDKILKEFNHLRRENPSLTMKDYLKKYSLNIYKIYNESILDDMNIDGDIHSNLFDELEEFESYLMTKNKGSSIQKHLSNLVNIFEYYLSEKSITLKGLDQVDIHKLFTNAIKDKFISSQDELNSYISTLKLYLLFSSNKNSNFKKSYKEILDISKNRFHYMNQLDSNNTFNIDTNLINRIDSKLNNNALNIIMDFETFLLFIGERSLELTNKNKYIKRKYLSDIDDLLILKSFIESLAPNQDNFPLIHLFYHTSLNLEISQIDGDFLMLNDRSINFLKLSDEEKYYLLFNYLLSEDFLIDILVTGNINYWQTEKLQFIKKLSKLKANKKYNIDSSLPKWENILSFYYKYLKFFGVVNYNSKDKDIVISNLGGKIFKYLNIKKEDKGPTVININQYRKKN